MHAANVADAAAAVEDVHGLNCRGCRPKGLSFENGVAATDTTLSESPNDTAKVLASAKQDSKEHHIISRASQHAPFIPSASLFSYGGRPLSSGPLSNYRLPRPLSLRMPPPSVPHSLPASLQLLSEAVPPSSPLLFVANLLPPSSSYSPHQAHHCHRRSLTWQLAFKSVL
ncbi:hypothetical protein SCHPADRAFT_399023 [Schizopora paradoxa]|uniref:Uncharacterized protein n=1 Tax=Schizopora paradoxa TaxID=27342 RepID=A0A0H2S7L7_9AGAM|nr:hypothetical protein SCHPADRAFT_399023 [Schizopora paradoxa]